MTDDAEYLLVMTTTDDEEHAHRLADGLVKEWLAACVQVTHIHSVYRWRGEVERSGEYLLLAKTRREAYPEVEAYILSHHPYEVPEVTCLPIVAGSAAYLAWMGENVRRT